MASVARGEVRATWPVAPVGYVRLLEVDPDLAPRRTAGNGGGPHAGPTAPVFRVGRGPLPALPPRTTDQPHLGFLVLKGMLIRDVRVMRRPTAEILGPGDLIQPPADAASLLPSSVCSTVLEPVLLAELGPLVTGRVGEWPDVVEGIVSRAVGRADALALQRAITSEVRVDVRLLAFLWHVADRYGVVVPGGVKLNVPLTHAVLARLVGARRPTVTTALQKLIRLGYLRREGRTVTIIGDTSAVDELSASSLGADGAPPSADGRLALD